MSNSPAGEDRHIHRFDIAGCAALERPTSNAQRPTSNKDRGNFIGKSRIGLGAGDEKVPETQAMSGP